MSLPMALLKITRTSFAWNEIQRFDSECERLHKFIIWNFTFLCKKIWKSWSKWKCYLKKIGCSIMMERQETWFLVRITTNHRRPKNRSIWKVNKKEKRNSNLPMLIEVRYLWNPQKTHEEPWPVDLILFKWNFGAGGLFRFPDDVLGRMVTYTFSGHSFCNKVYSTHFSYWICII